MTDAPKSAEELSPGRQLWQMIFAKTKTHLISVAAELGVADLLKDGPKTVEELAKTTKTHTSSLYRILRALAGEGIFAEIEERKFSLTPLAEALRSDSPDSVRASAMFFGKEWHNNAWSNLMHSVKTGECAFEHTFGKNFFDYLNNHPEDFTIFNEAMTSGSSRSATAICEAYDFSSFHTVVDVGGGHGQLLKTILQENPSVNGVLFDLPAVVKEADDSIGKERLGERYRIVEGDFFKSIPVGGDVYILKHIIHDWDDESASRVLNNCRGAMTGNSKLLVIDAVIPMGNGPFPAKLLDIEMMVLPGGLERTEAEFKSLFLTAGLKLKKIIPTQTTLSIIEAVRA